jgi:UDP-N-acetylmuramoylalanine--D-glutamate ligase
LDPVYRFCHHGYRHAEDKMIRLKTDTLILGLGRSGVAAARLLCDEGVAVTAVDAGQPSEEALKTLAKCGAKVIAQCTALPEGDFLQAIVSPGIPIDAPWLNELRDRNIALVSELELGWSRCAGKTLAITGSLGKSTMATWCHKALEAAGYTVALAGNIGKPVCEQALENPNLDVLVLEVSSFQCETFQIFCPDVALLLNLFPNHLDRHGDMDGYMAAKMRMFDVMEPKHIAVVPADLQGAVSALTKGDPAWQKFGVTNQASWSYRDGWVCKDQRPLVDLTGTSFANPVLGENAAGTVAALDALGITPDTIEQAARDFVSLPHRMEVVAERDGVTFINDSKSTSLTALQAAVNMIEGPVHLIAGGRAKEHEFDGILTALSGRPLQVYLIGEAASSMQAAWGDKLDCISSGSLQKAVEQCWSSAGAGDTILLSPGCASFDQFESFEDRGRQFRKLVQGLTPLNTVN